MVKNVRTHLLTAFDKLIQAHSLDHITVYQICQTAGVSRQSFYYHFGDIVDLLSAYIQETFNQQMNVHRVPFHWSQSFDHLLRIICFVMFKKIKLNSHTSIIQNSFLILNKFLRIMQSLFCGRPSRPARTTTASLFIWKMLSSSCGFSRIFSSKKFCTLSTMVRSRHPKA